MSELVSQVFFFLCSCCTLGDTFRSTGYAVLTDLGILFLLVEKSTESELAPLNSARIDHYLGVHVKGSKNKEGIACSINPGSKNQLTPRFKNKKYQAN